MNHIFKTVWNKALGQSVVASEMAKNSIGATTTKTSKEQTQQQDTIAISSLKLSTLTVVLAAVMTGSTAFALVEDDVIAPNYIETPHLNVGSNGSIYTSIGMGTDINGNPIGHISTGRIQTGEIQSSILDVFDAKVQNLEITGTVTGLNNINADVVQANQSLSVIADGAGIFSVNAKRDVDGNVIGGDLSVGDIHSSNIQTGSLDVTNDLSTGNLEVRGTLSAQNLDVQETTINNVADATLDHQAINLKQLNETNNATQVEAKLYTDGTATTLRSEATAESARLNQVITDGDTATLVSAKTYTDNTATTLRTEAATESARVDKAIADGDAMTLASAKAHTNTIATTLRTEAATESARLDQAIADGNASTLASANKTTADMATAIRNEVTDSDAKILADAKAHTNQTATTTLSNAKQYTDQTTVAVLEQAKAYTDANAHASPFIALQTNTDDEHAKAEGKNAIAMGTGAIASGDQSIAIGVGNQVSGHNSGAFGDPNTVSGNDSYVVGNNNTVSGDNTFVLGNDVNTNATNTVVLGNASTSDRDNTVSVGSVGGERQVIHVAAATADSDAVNLKQMNMAGTATLVSAKMHTDNTATTLRHEAAVESTRVNKAIVDGDKVTLASAKGYTDTRVATFDRSINQLNNRVNQLNTRVDDVERTAYRGIAIALAAQQAVPSIQPGQVAVFGGVGHYEGETAGSIGVVTSFTDRISASGALGFAGGNEFGGRVGVAYVFGGK